MFFLFLKYEFSKFLLYFRYKKIAKFITITCFIFVFYFVARGLFLFFKWGIVYITKDAYLKFAMPLFVYEMFFLIVMLIVFLSGFIAGIFGFFSKEKDEWILSSPRYKNLPFLVFLKVFFNTLITVLLVSLPAILGIKSAINLNLIETFLVIFSVVLLVLFSVLSSFVLLFILSFFFLWLSHLFKRVFLSFKTLSFSLVFLALVFVILGCLQIKNADILILFKPQDLKLDSPDINSLFSNFYYLPSHFPSLILFLLQSHDIFGSLLEFFKFFILIILLFLLFFIFSRNHLLIWENICDFSKKKKESVNFSFYRKSIKSQMFLKGSAGAVFWKEAVSTFRNSKNALWITFMSFIWFIQSGLNFFIKRNIEKHGSQVSNTPELLLVLQIVVVVFFISAFVLRFSFPSFSVDSKYSWIIGSAPIDIKKIFWSKFLFYSSIFVLLGFFVGFVDVIVLGSSFVESTLFFVFILISVLYVNALGMGIGAIFPNLETDDPEILSTTLPGIGFVLGSVSYGGIGAFLLYKFLTGSNSFLLFIFEIVSFLIVAAFLYLAPISLSKREIAMTKT